ncbi:MAG TPA: hemerythrin domain-containing protein [Thermoanaerobaculia bacterium]
MPRKASARLSRPTEPFRREHAQIRAELRQIDRWVDRLPDADAAMQKTIMVQIVRTLKEHVLVHAEWEERVLYPAVDRRAGSGPMPFTASMRHDHTIAIHQMAEIDTESARPRPDPRWFARRTDQLLGLLLAHLDAEESLLLPILDKSMTAEEYVREIGAHS